MKTTTRKPTRRPAAPPEPQVRASLHREFWKFLWRHYHKLDKFTLSDIEVWGPAHGFTVLTQWICREMCACAPSQTKRVWATCGMLLTPQIAAQDTGRGFARDTSEN